MVEATGPCLPPGYLIFYHLPTKVGNLPDRTGEMAPTLVWCHPCSNEDQSPHLFEAFLGLIVKSTNPPNTNKKLKAPLSRCRVLMFIYVWLSRATSIPQTHPNQARESMEDWLLLHVLAEGYKCYDFFPDSLLSWYGNLTTYRRPACRRNVRVEKFYN